jgi:multiple antibiotic resistance protein
MHHSPFITFTVAMFAILNPVGNAAIFIGLTANRSLKEQHKSTYICAIAVWIILLLSVWIGPWLLKAFGISVGAFEIAGGLVVLLIALNMISGKTHPESHHDNTDHKEAQQKEFIAVVPMAIPIVAGPGAISAIIAHASIFPTIGDKITETLITLGLAIIVGVSFFLAPWLAKILGPFGLKIVTRIMGLIIAAIAFQFISSGLLAVFPGFS